jgi:hypothetical protein
MDEISDAEKCRVVIITLPHNLISLIQGRPCGHKDWGVCMLMSKYLVHDPALPYRMHFDSTFTHKVPVRCSCAYAVLVLGRTDWEFIIGED